jgi:hypothetical protein
VFVNTVTASLLTLVIYLTTITRSFTALRCDSLAPPCISIKFTWHNNIRLTPIILTYPNEGADTAEGIDAAILQKTHSIRQGSKLKMSLFVWNVCQNRFKRKLLAPYESFRCTVAINFYISLRKCSANELIFRLFDDKSLPGHVCARAVSTMLWERMRCALHPRMRA